MSETPERERLAHSLRQIVRARELSGRGPRWIRAWKRTLFRYNELLRRLERIN